jgi:hypothetical protein
MSGYVIGIDVGKSTFHLVAMDQAGNIVQKKRFSRPQLLNQMLPRMYWRWRLVRARIVLQKPWLSRGTQ